ncbi:hypothetical protein DLH72_05315 [Candidatus Gracilibacteria bacterium]|nr:MAG: hypothetical protein DLH72_05315 [Candidatus Gracilibacteria bacterium]
MSQHITCPNCKTEIDLEKLADEKYLEKLREQEEKLKKEQEIQREKFEKEMERERNEMREKAKKFAEEQVLKARKESEAEMKFLQEQLQKADKEKEEAKKKEIEFMKKQREIEEKEKNFELEMEKKILEERKKIEENLGEKIKENANKEFDEKLQKYQEEFRKKELEYQKQQEQLKKSLDDAQRKAEQGSQQIQGDISENDLKEALNQAFPIDSIDDVPTGVKGADLIQSVKNNFGQIVGTIVWESKNTKAWSESWIMKLKEDTLKVGGNISILVTNILPKEIKNFGIYDEVMVCSPEFAVSVATILRDKILSISKVEKSLEGKDLKMELLYKYLTSQEFSSKISMMVQVFSNLKSGIDAERRAMEKNWKKREKDLERATFAITGMYGELESLMGQTLPGAEVLELGAGDDFDDEE